MSEPAVREWPTSREIAQAVVAAARVMGEDPLAVVDPAAPSKARVYAFGALAHRFQQLSHPEVARLLGHRDPASPASRSFVPWATTSLRHGYGLARDWVTLENLNRVVAACGWPLMSAGEMKLYRSIDAQRASKTAARLEREAANLAKWEAGGKPKFKSEKARKAFFGRSLENILAEHKPEALATRPPAARGKPGESEPIGRVASDFVESRPPPVDVPRPPIVARTPAALNASRALTIAAPAKPAPSRALAARPTFDLSSHEISYHPDTPLTEREDVVVLTAEFCGDPAPQRSALWARQIEEARKRREED